MTRRKTEPCLAFFFILRPSSFILRPFRSAFGLLPSSFPALLVYLHDILIGQQLGAVHLLALAPAVGAGVAPDAGELHLLRQLAVDQPGQVFHRRADLQDERLFLVGGLPGCLV